MYNHSTPARARARQPRNIAGAEPRRGAPRIRTDTDTDTDTDTSTGARDARIQQPRAKRWRGRAQARRIARGTARALLGRDRALRRVDAPEGRLECGGEAGLYIARELADEHRAVVAPQRRDGLVDAVALNEQRAVRVHVADSAQDAQQVELHDCLAVA